MRVSPARGRYLALHRDRRHDLLEGVFPPELMLHLAPLGVCPDMDRLLVLLHRFKLQTAARAQTANVLRKPLEALHGMVIVLSVPLHVPVKELKLGVLQRGLERGKTRLVRGDGGLELLVGGELGQVRVEEKSLGQELQQDAYRHEGRINVMPILGTVSGEWAWLSIPLLFWKLA